MARSDSSFVKSVWYWLLMINSSSPVLFKIVSRRANSRSSFAAVVLAARFSSSMVWLLTIPFNCQIIIPPSKSNTKNGGASTPMMKRRRRLVCLSAFFCFLKRVNNFWNFIYSSPVVWQLWETGICCDSANAGWVITNLKLYCPDSSHFILSV